jgi:hypothetical protein
MFLDFRKTHNRRQKTPKRLIATLMSIVFAIAMLFSVIFYSCRAVVATIEPPPLKQDTVTASVLRIIQAKTDFIKKWAYKMFSLWRIFRWERVFATL